MQIELEQKIPDYSVPGNDIPVSTGENYFVPDSEAPIQSNSDFISGLYQTYYGRTPDSGGLQFWVGQLTSGLHTRESATNAFATTPDMSPNPGQSLVAFLKNPIDLEPPGAETKTFATDEVVDLTTWKNGDGNPLTPDVENTGSPVTNAIINPISNLLGTQIISNNTGSNQVAPPGVAPPIVASTSNADLAGTGLEDLPNLAKLFGLFSGANNQIDARRSEGSGFLVVPGSTPDVPPSGNDNRLLIVLAIIAIAIPIGLHFYAKHKS